MASREQLGVWSEAPLLPRPVSTFMGRDLELARAEALLSHEVLCLIYGVAGMGKTECLYALLERLSPHFAEPPCLLRCGELGAESWLDALARRLRVNAAPEPSRDGQIRRVARALESSGLLVVIDELERSELTLSTRALGYFARHLRSARIVAASRVELTFASSDPQPVVIRLKPFDENLTHALVRRLSARAGLVEPPEGSVFQTTRGEPLAIVRVTLGEQVHGEPSDDPIASMLRALKPGEMRVLCALAVAGGPIAYREALDHLGPKAAEHVKELGRRLLVERTADGTWLSAEPLVKERALELVAEDVLCEARRAIARLRITHFEHRPDTSLSEAIEAARQFALAQDLGVAEAVVQRIYRRVCASGLELRLLPIWQLLDRARDGKVCGTELMRARTALRHGDVAAAERHLNDCDSHPARFYLQRALVRIRAIELDEASELLALARRLAEGSQERVVMALCEASLLALMGSRASAQKALARAVHEASPPSARESARIELVRARLSWMEGDLAEAKRIVDTARSRMTARTGSDLVTELTLLGLLACLELKDVQGARGLVDAHLLLAGESGQLRAREIGILQAALMALESQIERQDESRVQKAVARLNELRLQAERAFAAWDVLFCEHFLANIHEARGDANKASEIRERARSVLRERGASALSARLFPAPSGSPEVRPSAELVIDLVRAEIRSGSGQSITGRHQACELLARLATAEGKVVSAEALYADVWGGHNYHPLRHRNAIYVAINRLRRAISELLPGGEWILTTPEGWRLAPELRARVLRA